MIAKVVEIHIVYMDDLQAPWRSHASFSIAATNASEEKPGCLSTIDTFGLKEVGAKDAKCWMLNAGRCGQSHSGKTLHDLFWWIIMSKDFACEMLDHI